MSRYRVVCEFTVVHDIEADSPEDAAQVVLEGDGGDGSVEHVSVSKVIPGADGSFVWEHDDLRAAVPCRSGCGKSLAPDGPNPCTPCWLAAQPEVSPR